MAKAKGTTLVGAVRFLRKNRERAAAVLPAELQHYLDEQISVAAWYPESDLHGLLRATLELIPGARDEVLAGLGANAAREHLEGIYAHLGGGGVEGLSRRAVALWSSQHDTGRFEMERLSETESRLTVRDFGHPSELMCGILGGYLTETLRFEGATDVAMVKESCVLRGDDACTWRHTYRPPDPARAGD